MKLNGAQSVGEAEYFPIQIEQVKKKILQLIPKMLLAHELIHELSEESNKYYNFLFPFRFYFVFVLGRRMARH